MNKKELTTANILFGIFVISIVLYMCLTFKPVERTVNNYYQISLGGERIGLIKSRDELYNLIDQEQTELKEKYKVNKVYPPSGLEVQSIKTYKTNLMTAEEVYEEIKDLDPFTIEGYEVTVTLDDNTNKKFYCLNKEDLDKAVENTVTAFLDKNDYQDYLEGKAKETDEEGTEVTDVYFGDDVTIKKTLISTENEIMTNADDLSMYFLFGTTNLTHKYTVKASDTIETIAEKNRLGVQDFLIANPDIAGENALLAVGQEVIVATINPVAKIMVDSFETETQTIKYDTKVVLDKSLDASTKYVKQKGVNGLSKVVFATRERNGIIMKSEMVSEEIINEAVEEIVVIGAKNVSYYGNTTYWAWPTTQPFRFSSMYGYRRDPVTGAAGAMHRGVDIVGTKSDNIFAIQSGTVVEAGYSSSMGNHIDIDHGNGYTSIYMHLKSRIVTKGTKVDKGQLIGIMGSTGKSTGKHLHLAIKKNGQYMNPMLIYK